MATRRRSRTPAMASEVRDGSRARLSSVATDATDEYIDGDDDAAPGADDSTGSNGRRRSRPEINRRVPQSSFAYGAPSDGTSRPRAVSSSRKSVDSTRSPSVPSSPEKKRLPDFDRASSAQPQPPTQQPASVRYSALRARNNAAANAATHSSSISTLLERGAASPARRSARFSVAPEDSDAGPSSTRRGNGASHNADVEESEEEDAYGKNRKSSVPPPSSSSMVASRSRITAGEQQLNSIFLRAPGSASDGRSRAAHSTSPGPAEQRERLLMTSSLLRGAQRPSHDPLSPRRTDMDSTRSSDVGDSRSYASEEAYVRDHGRDDEDDPRDVTPPARGPATEGWVGRLAQMSPWRRAGTPNGNAGAENEPSGSQSAHGEKSTADGKTASTSKRRSRASQDTLWRPSREDEEDDSDDDEDAGPRKKGRRRRVSDRSSARGGRDDNKIWANGKRRKGRKTRQEGADGQDDGDLSDSSLTSIGAMNEGDVADVDFAAAKQDTTEASKGKEKAGSATAAASQPRPPSTDFAKWIGLLLLGLLLLGTFAPSQKTASPIRQTSFASRLPVIGHLFSGGAPFGDFAAPDLPPSDFDSFVARLLSLETSVAAISSTSTSLLNSQDQMSRKIAALELSSKEVRSLLDKVDEAAKNAQKGLDGKIRALEAVGDKMRSQASKLEADVASISDSVQKDRSAMEKRLQSLQANLERNDEELARVRASARQAEGVANEAKEALRPILEANLPAQMPVRLDAKTGKAQIEPWFYDHLKQIFGSTNTQGAAAVPETSWVAFRAANDAALRALAAEEADRVLDVRSSSRDKHATLSRSDFLEVLQAEIEAMKATLEENFNANAQEMQNEILGKVRAQQNMYEESASWTKGKKAPRGGNESPLSGIPDLAGLQMKDGSNPTQSILALIDAALETYSADRLNKADFALYSAGGRVIPSMTSPSYEIPSLARRSWLSWVPGAGPSKSTQHLRSRSPVVALHHDNAPGMCWPFAGQSGQLGIQLARKAIVTDITIEHPATALTFGDSSSAPREVTVSALVERAEDRRKLAEWKRQQEEERMLDGRGDERDDDDGSLEMVSAPPSPNHIHLATFTYDPSSHRSVQTFPVSAEARALRIPVSILQVHVLSNNGEKAYTCLYRVRVHGEAWKDENES